VVEALVAVCQLGARWTAKRAVSSVLQNDGTVTGVANNVRTLQKTFQVQWATEVCYPPRSACPFANY